MSGFDEIYGQMETFYEEAVKRLAELEEERKKVEATIKQLNPLFQNKKYSVDVLKAVEPKRTSRSKKSQDAADTKKREVRAKAPKEGKPERSKRRIKEQSVRESCLKFLTKAAPDSRSGSEILDYLLKEEGYPATQSFRTRVYTLLGKWSNDKDIPIKKISRGLYSLEEEAAPDNI